jgi:hypothetical protein
MSSATLRLCVSIFERPFVIRHSRNSGNGVESEYVELNFREERVMLKRAPQKQRRLQNRSS